MRTSDTHLRVARTIAGLAVTLSLVLPVAPWVPGAAAQGAQKPDGVVVAIRDGKLERFQQDLWNALTVGQPVSRGNRVRTDGTAVAIVTLAEIGRIVMGPSSDVELGKNPKDFKVTMQRGFAWLDATLPKGSKASISTSLATAGVRGTGFSVCYDGKNYCACTCFGEVEVSVPGGPTVRVPRGEYYAFPAGAPLPGKTEAAATLLEKTGAGFDFCFTCHVVAGKGRLKPDRK
ncbi:MAG: FecR domain-containing protein [Candidatus Rokubacteria bacterium]|nr:FecR domain-containing protein [Candidatus Rokubacteria bacterium]